MDSVPPSLQLDIKEFLRPILFGLAEEDLDILAKAAVIRSLPTDTVICEEGEPGNTFYIIVEGQVEVLKRLDGEHERRLNVIGPGGFFGEMAILQEGPRTATVRVTEPITVLEIGREPFLRVLGRSPSLSIRMLVGMTARLRDGDRQSIADLRQANEELTRALRRLERLDKTKSDFIQVSAHELRTPVAVLLGYAQMIQNSPTVQNDSYLQTLVEGMVGSTKRLERVFNSILDVSRVMSGGLQARRSLTSIPVIFEGIASEFKRALEERNLTLEREGLQELPLCWGDPDLLYKAFYHLVNNSIKYTPDGGRIKVIGQTVEAPDLGQCIEVAVEDTGIGIAPQDLDLVFEKFYRTGEVALHSSGTTTFKGGGPGLGLTIAQGAVLAHDGRIWAESPGYDEEACPGSRFVVQLPLEP
ncbi:MAG: cyclic nucleotide-binding domain-containing protein [Anaerolineae bacterium]